ncbi:Nucleolar pre-ribosomal-associated protein 1 [Senna tora]|uniref:Nucleolar pre-ribosomal-associated protein 1 n=1 Tax=Senna tora TaxID=362788 RepID=A0A834TZ37_9FABA|nr:Nucleolar pre-ribosomal-associated protein 1 [Senna tora]
MGLRLLLTTVQNSIEEPWQRIPSVIALFAAEASFVLLDSSHDHFAAISTLLIHSSKLNLRVIPLFDNFVWSTSVNFKAERLWMLRLVYVGLNSDDDALLYIRNSIFETLMSFYVSPLSDFESKELIIKVIQKSVKLHKIGCHLVKHCSLFSWFSSLISITRQRLNREEERFLLKQVLVVLKVANDVISCGSISKWLQNSALEQLAELTANLFTFILHDATLTDEAVALINPFLQMIASLLKISQKRKIYQPHFTLSIEGLYKIYQVVGQCNHATIHVNPEFALEAILMNAPPDSIFLMNEERLENFLIWAISTALQAESSQKLMSYESRIYSMENSGEERYKNSLVSKVLRWLTASVIIGKLYHKSNDMDPRFAESQNFKSLDSLLEHVENMSGQRNEITTGCEELLASTIFYLQLLPGINYEVLPSVVSALCLLLFDASNSAVGKTDLLEDYSSFISHCSRVRCPPEANPTWRWSFHQPWKDHSQELSELEKMDEYHACQILLVIISNVLGGKKLESANLSPVDIEKSGVFKWERSLLKPES